MKANGIPEPTNAEEGFRNPNWRQKKYKTNAEEGCKTQKEGRRDTETSVEEGRQTRGMALCVGVHMFKALVGRGGILKIAFSVRIPNGQYWR